MWQEGGNSDAHRYWGAATVNNTLNEFHAYAEADGIHTLPKDLDIFIARNRRDGFAVMDVQHVLSGLGYTALELIEGIFAPFGPLISLIGGGGIEAYLPQVQIGIDYRNSDQLKRLAYHELAHASYYTQVSLWYWTKVAGAEIAADGHGQENSLGAGIIEVAESWAGYLGHTYAHQTYPMNSSLGGTWELNLERTWNEKANHIPIGLHHDLKDFSENTYKISGVTYSACNAKGGGCTIVNDNVSRFTNAQMFSCLTSSTQNIDDYKSSLIGNYLSTTGNTVSQMNDLFNSY